MASKLEKILNSVENALDSKEIIEEFLNKQYDLEESLYIGFKFHQGGLHNFKILNSLNRVIPQIEKFIAHEGIIYVKIKDKESKVFSGETTAEIIEFLVSKK